MGVPFISLKEPESYEALYTSEGIDDHTDASGQVDRAQRVRTWSTTQLLVLVILSAISSSFLEFGVGFHRSDTRQEPLGGHPIYPLKHNV